MPMEITQTTILGGGVVGLSVALGLLQAGRGVVVFDGADTDQRASQGNFGLVWLQGKGAGYAPYARWTSAAVAGWTEWAKQLTDLSGINVQLERPGGYEFFTDPAELDGYSQELESQKKTLGADLPIEILTANALRRQISGIGSKVVGASYCDRDGHVNPLLLLRALRVAVQRLGGQIHHGTPITHVAPVTGGGVRLTDAQGQTYGAERLILCAGLGATPLAPQLGFSTRVYPQRGELLITEKLGSKLPFLSSTIRQVNEGGIQIGGTSANAGLNDSDTLAMTAQLARHAVDVFPALSGVRVVRSWGALRIMTDDGYPIYARSPICPEAYLVTCHSGVTLAPNHAGGLVNWIEGASNAPNLEAFDEHRFPISKAA